MNKHTFTQNCDFSVSNKCSIEKLIMLSVSIQETALIHKKEYGTTNRKHYKSIFKIKLLNSDSVKLP